MRKAVALVSGGLDSLLAARLMLEQGITVSGINFYTGFAGDHDYRFRRDSKPADSARRLAQQLGIDLHIVDVQTEFRDVVLHPHYGYGAHLNPCLDCKLFMIRQAFLWMKEHDYDFLVTGEVVGQRPMSQRIDTLPLASKITENLIVRPLSAQLLPETVPEQRGWIKRELMYGIHGRGREMQLKLAAQFGFEKIPQPAGGCVLTDANFCKRFADLCDHSSDRLYALDDLLFLHLGRHFRVSDDLHLIVGRDEVENNFLREHAGERLILHVRDFPGAQVILDGVDSLAHRQLAAQLAAFFSKGRNCAEVAVVIEKGEHELSTLTVTPLTHDQIVSWYI